MNRRGFLGLLGMATAAVAVPAAVLEELAPKRTIILPPRGGWPDFDTANMRYKAIERFSAGIVDPRAALMTPEDFYRSLADGLNEVFRKEYAAHREFDGVQLSHTPHPTMSNKLPATELTEAALEDLLMEINMRTDERGLLMRPPPFAETVNWYVKAGDEAGLKRFFRSRT